MNTQQLMNFPAVPVFEQDNMLLDKDTVFCMKEVYTEK